MHVDHKSAGDTGATAFCLPGEPEPNELPKLKPLLLLLRNSSMGQRDKDAL